MAAYDLNLLESHVSYGGQQRRYENYAAPLDRKLALEIYVPEAQLAGKSCVVLYYLPEITDSAETAASQSDYQRYANRYDVIVVIPDLFSSYHGGRAERIGQYLQEQKAISQYVLQSLPEIIDHHFNAYEIRSIMGFGFGGTLALNLALDNRLLFRSASAFAPWLGFVENSVLPNEYCPLQKIRSIGRQRIIPMWIDQGSADPLLGAEISHSGAELGALFAAHPQTEELFYRPQPRYDHSYYFVHSHIRQHFVFHAEYHENL